MKFRECQRYFNLEEYIDFLIGLRTKGEILLIEKIVMENKEVFPLDLRNLDEISILKQKILIRKSIETSKDHLELKKIIGDYKKHKTTSFFIDTQKVFEPKHFFLLRMASLKEINSDIELICDIESKHFVKLYDYNLISFLETGNYFGDIALDKNDHLR